MKNELLRIVFVSSLAIGALAITSPSYAQQAGGHTGGQTGGASNGPGADNGGGGHFTRKARRSRGNPNYPRRRRTKAYIPAGECECTTRKASRNSNAATYRICKKRVQLNDGTLMTRSCQPTG